MRQYPTMLTIAGSDSIGGAGIQADIKTCCALGVYAMSVITAITAQNTTGVKSYTAISEDMLREQLEAVMTDVNVDAVKIGMLPDAGSITVVADILQKYKVRNIVVDPVMVATSGDSLFDGQDSTIKKLVSRLFSIADVVTPNIPEAETLSGIKITDRDSRIAAARAISLMVPNGYVYLKGGHMEDDKLEDIMVSQTDANILSLVSDKIDTINTHGTGCSLSSAIASFLSKGNSVNDAVTMAKRFINEAIKRGADYKLGAGHGSINHLFKIQDYDSESK